MADNKILYGDRTFTNVQILPNAKITQERSLLSDVLTIDTLEFDVESEDTTLTDFVRNTQLTYYRDEQPMGIYFVQSVDRTAKNKYHFSCTSVIGLLDESDHNGGIYTGETVETVVADICGTLPCIVKNNIRNIKLYGWLPIATRRENLTQVLFAIGATLKVDFNGAIRIEGLWDSQSTEIGSERMYSGGSVKYDTRVTEVNVTEHSYSQSATETVELFDGTTSEGDKITFTAPHYDLQASGFSILEQHANYAIVSSGSGKLTGKPYVHTTRLISKKIEQPTRDLVNVSDNVVKVENATLVSLANSNAIADRLVNYYSHNERIVNNVVAENEEPGDVVQIAHPYGGEVQGCIESSDVAISGILKANETVLLGFTPQDIGEAEYYDKREVITADATWTVPETVSSIQVILIGGGQGGGMGQDGESGGFSTTSGGTGGAGGKGGKGGRGGKVLQRTLDVQPGEQFNAIIGIGGSPATSAGLEPENGTNTYFGSLSSDNGTSSTNGFFDVIANATYALPGKDGVDGGAGGHGGIQGTNAEDGEDVGANTGGIGAEEYFISSGEYAGSWAGGGAGSGAAYGKNGNNGEEGYRSGGLIYGGAGGDGITPDAAELIEQNNYGAGGNGGHGGSGGGGSGGAQNTKGDLFEVPGNPGVKGNGSIGSAGGNGCVIIYYRIQVQAFRSGQIMTSDGKMFNERFERMVIA